VTISLLPEISASRAHELIDSFLSRRIMVFGDVMLDRFMIGGVARISPEAPVPVVVFDHEEIRLGGAANVAHNLRALGAAVDLIGVIGQDDSAAQLKSELAAKGIHATGLITDPERRTTTKMRVVTSRNQQVSRIDFESDHEVGTAIEAALGQQAEMRARSAQVVLVSDYLKGVVTRRSMTSVLSVARASGVPVIVDPKVPHIDYYAGAALVTPNHVEAESATNSRISSNEDARRAAVALRQRIGVESVLITRGEHGMWLDHAGTDGYLPASAREVADVTGAGDTVIATLALAIAAGGTMFEAARLANEAASIVVGKFGAATVAPDELKARFQS
jgi:D-beta-D-heptose 7-phosphate kinase/D-beta-D-heptose 1-phosphate adenosyltransferase